MTTQLDEAGLDEYTDRFARDALRCEVLTGYDVGSDRDGFARWRGGQDEPDPDVVGPWGSWVRDQVDRGASVRRLRVLHEQPNDYLRFEMSWAYRANVEAGEQVRILDLTEQPDFPELVDAEMWLLDGERVAFLHYDEAGRFTHADAVAGVEGRAIARAVDASWAVAEPFTDWWARHPEYHRPRG